MKNFSEIHGFRMIKHEVPKPWKPLRLKRFTTIFELCGQFFFQNDFFKLQEDFSELRIRIILVL
jgi:hypothetical protein